MKILYVTTIGSTMGFFKSLIRELLDQGNIVDIATNEDASKVQDCYREWGCKIYNISCSRSPFSLGNVKAIKQIRQLAKDYDIVHCHTPLASMATRFACRKLRKQGVKVIYTAHGFHFYKGAPLKNWLIYYPIEKLCSRWTDVLITITKDDYALAKKKMRAKEIEYVPGVGIDVERFSKTTVDRDKKLAEFGVPADAVIILSVGELNKNKNHQIVIKALSLLKNDNYHYLIAGKGDQKDHLEQLAKKLNVNLHLLGYRSDVAELYKVADVYVLPSIREGLNVSIMEAMASGLPCVVSDIRGNRDLIAEKNGRLCSPLSSESFAKSIKVLVDHNGSINYQENNKLKSELFKTAKINAQMINIYCGDDS